MPIVIKKKIGVSAAPVIGHAAHEAVVSGFSREQSVAITFAARDRWIISLAKRMAREDYEKSLKESPT